MLAHIGTTLCPEGYFSIWLYKNPGTRNEERHYRAFFSMNERPYAAQFLKDMGVTEVEFGSELSERDREWLGWLERAIQG